MEKDTLDQLQKVFTITPSAQLANIICDHLVQDDDQLQDFINDIGEKLTTDDQLTVAHYLTDKNKHQLALNLLDAKQVNHIPCLINNLIALKKNDQANHYYQLMIEQEPQRKDPQLEQKLENQLQNNKKKATLKIVEKVDKTKIADISLYQQKNCDFSDVVGLDAIKKQIHKKIILPFQKPSLFQRFKKKVGGGVLLYGPPGCGKTLLARATAGECQATFYNIEVADILDMYIGESEQKLRAIFEKARKETPCILFFDEFEALATKRDSGRNSSFNNIVSQFLTELDGFAQNNSGLLILASTNVPWSIDSAFLRPGRFDRSFFVPPPDKQARQAIMQHHMLDRPADQNINYSALAAKCSGFSGADLFNLIENAADEAIDATIETGHDTLINHNHFKAAIDTTHSTTTEWLTTARNYARYANDGGRYNDVLAFIKKHGK